MKIHKFVNFVAWFMFFSLLNNPSFLEAQEDPAFKRKTKSKYKIVENEDTNDTETVLDVDSGVFLGFGSFSLGMCKLKSAMIGCYGVNGSWVMREKYLIGIDFQGGTGSSEKLKPRDFMIIEEEARPRFSQVSLLLGIVNDTHKVYHPVFSILIGQLTASYTNLDGLFIPSYYSENAKFFMVEPIAEYEMNFTKYIRFSVGASAKIPLSQPDNRSFKAEDVFGPRLFLSFKAGNFRY